jgi:nitroreductase
VPADIIEEAIEVALQAPTGANSQGWRFVVVTDAAVRRRIGELYRRGSELYLQGKTGLSRTGMSVASEYAADDPRARRMGEVVKSAVYLIENIDRVPVHLIPCIQGALRRRGSFHAGSDVGIDPSRRLVDQAYAARSRRGLRLDDVHAALRARDVRRLRHPGRLYAGGAVPDRLAKERRLASSAAFFRHGA